MGALAAGERFGDYVLVRRLASGGNDVWESVDRVGTRYAIKVWDGSFEDDRRRRLAERTAALSAVVHPSLTRVHEVTVIGDRLAIVMELHAGIGLGEHLMMRGSLAFPEAVLVAMPIAEALSRVHAAGLWHGTLSPGRIMLTPGHAPKLIGFDEYPLLLDVDNDEDRVLGNPLYHPPEMITAGVLDARGDVYSFGMVVFAICAGRQPYVEHTTAELVMEKLQPARRLREWAPDAPQEIDDLVAAMLDPDPARRPPVDALCELAR
jgi:eukaryotic-like serine/threonine-protein kinase